MKSFSIPNSITFVDTHYTERKYFILLMKNQLRFSRKHFELKIILL